MFRDLLHHVGGVNHNVQAQFSQLSYENTFKMYKLMWQSNQRNITYSNIECGDIYKGGIEVSCHIDISTICLSIYWQKLLFVKNKTTIVFSS